jgi:hypothetical protein
LVVDRERVSHGVFDVLVGDVVSLRADGWISGERAPR